MTAAIACFRIEALSDPQILPRLLNYVAQLGMTPQSVHAERRGDVVTVRIAQPELTAHQAATIAEKMRASVLVVDVQLAIEELELFPPCVSSCLGLDA